VPHDRLPDLYRQNDLFVLTSRHEAQGMAPLEAAACGLPVVGTAVGILPELAPSAALTVPIGDHAALAVALAAYVTSPGRRHTMSRSAIAATARYSLPTTTDHFRTLYRTVATVQIDA
jgi:glycosyltransferase involved in cell wall biosynthesis